MWPLGGFAEDSAIANLARISSPIGQNWKEVLMGMTAAFDASGDESSQLIIVVAGFISSAGDWEEFSKLWTKRLNDDGICYMHMKEFAHSVGQFSKGWKGNKPRRDALLGDLMYIIKSNTYRKFGIVVVNETFRNTIPLDIQEEWHLNAYSLAGRGCALQTNEWAKDNRYKGPIDLVFEEGDAGATLLHKRLVEDGYQAPIFKPKKDRRTPQNVLLPAFVPLQAADFLAYELFLEVTRMMQDSEIHQRWGMHEFDTMMGSIGTYTVEDLQRFQEMATISKRIDEWSISNGFLYRDKQGRLCRDVKVRSCKLETFTWGKVTSDDGRALIEPICFDHQSSRIEVLQAGEEVTVTCKPTGGGKHSLGATTVPIFLNEQVRATQDLSTNA